MDSSPELTAIDRCTEKLVYVIKIDPLSITLKLISKELLPHTLADRMRLVGITEEVKATGLVASVRGLIAECPEKFNDFVRILKEEPWLNSVSETLSSSYSKCIKHRDSVMVVGKENMFVWFCPQKNFLSMCFKIVYR